LAELGLNYVRLEGNIGNIVNGAGLAMATTLILWSFFKIRKALDKASFVVLPPTSKKLAHFPPIVNGAGLAMATNDLISLHGGKCANFLDVGGSTTKEALSRAFRILKNDRRISHAN
jgi:succinyl-CoA synthetase beta subunit